MPPRKRTAPDSLSPEDLVTLADAVASGKRATVYIIEAVPSLGLPEGTSAKVVGIEGSTVTISPKGVDDELPYEAEELRLKRLPVAAPAKQIAPRTAATRPTAETRSAVTRPAVTGPAVTRSAVTRPVPTASPTRPPATVIAGPPAQSATPTRRQKKVPGGISVTIYAGADNDWSVTVTQGAKRPTKAQPVSPESVSRAVRELGDPTARDAVEAVISHAREEAARRVAELSRQLEEARTTLAALEQDV